VAIRLARRVIPAESESASTPFFQLPTAPSSVPIGSLMAPFANAHRPAAATVVSACRSTRQLAARDSIALSLRGDGTTEYRQFGRRWACRYHSIFLARPRPETDRRLVRCGSAAAHREEVRESRSPPVRKPRARLLGSRSRPITPIEIVSSSSEPCTSVLGYGVDEENET